MKERQAPVTGVSELVLEVSDLEIANASVSGIDASTNLFANGLLIAQTNAAAKLMVGSGNTLQPPRWGFTERVLRQLGGDTE